MDGVFAAISHTWYREGEGEPTSPKSCKRKRNENDAALKPTNKFAAQGLAIKSYLMFFRARGLDAGKEDDHPKEVIAFCSPTENPYGQFSNYYKRPFTYVVPLGSKKDTVIQCEHANTALFCTKASLCKDDDTFNMIMKEPDPGKCRKLGRVCEGFDQKVWDDNIKRIAFEVLRLKFYSDEDLKALLLDTGDDCRTI